MNTTPRLVPPDRDGVGASSVWLPVGNWNTVLEFLVDRFTEIEAETWIARMTRGDIVTEFGETITPDRAYHSGMRLYYYRELPGEPAIPFDAIVLHQDEHIVAVDKPHFLPVIPAGRFLRETLLVRLKRKLDLDFIVPLHRLDRETAGVVLFSICPQTRAAYHALFAERQVHKTYHALAPALQSRDFPMTRRSRIVQGDPFFLMRETAGLPNAETRVDVQASEGESALYQLTPVTGRKHQLRLHMASLGAPIFNDRYYPHLREQDPDDFSRPLQLLAKAIAFTDPVTGKKQEFRSSRTLSFSNMTTS